MSLPLKLFLFLCNSDYVLLILWINNTQVLSYTKWYQKSRAFNDLFKFPQQDTPMGYGSAEVTIKRNQQITMTQHILRNISQNKWKNMFLILVSHLCFARNLFLWGNKTTEKNISVSFNTNDYTFIYIENSVSITVKY